MGFALSVLKDRVLHGLEIDQHGSFTQCGRHVEVVAVPAKSTVAVAVYVGEHTLASSTFRNERLPILSGPFPGSRVPCAGECVTKTVRGSRRSSIGDRSAAISASGFSKIPPIQGSEYW